MNIGYCSELPEQLGLVDQAEIEIADLTLVCGENNTGKTYVTYAIYGFLRSWKRLLHLLLKDEIDAQLKNTSQCRIDLLEMFDGNIDEYLSRMGKEYVKILPRAFATEPDVFENTVCVPRVCKQTDFLTQSFQRQVQSGINGKILATLSKEVNSTVLEVLVADNESSQTPFRGLTVFVIEAIADIIFAQHLPRAHIASAERTGAAIFRKELDMARTRTLKAINEVDSKELRRNPFKIFEEIESDYAWPVGDNVEFVRHLEDFDKGIGELADARPELIEAFNSIIGGSYKVVKQQLIFQPKGASKQRFTMNEASSCIRALLDIGFFLRCRARIGDIFIIDEPELNLHPKNQRAFARLVARLVNAGIKVFITTHSDYMIKELNTLIMLNQNTDHTNKVKMKYGYDDAELLDSGKIRLYMTGIDSNSRVGTRKTRKLKTLKLAKIYSDSGIEVETFDSTIEIMNNIQNEIMYGGDL